MFENLSISFIAGLLAPLGAVCVIPLYPGFLAYLSTQLKGKEDKKTYVMLGVITTLGIILSMFLFGLIFAKFLASSLTSAIGIISPIAFGLLAIISIFLLFNYDFGNLIPKMNAPVLKSPIFSSLVFGLFFGAIVLPCNPATLTVLFALSTTTLSFLSNLLNFVFYGIGMATPILFFSIASANYNQAVISWLTRHKKTINITTGVIMLSISMYYLIFVFHIFG